MTLWTGEELNALFGPQISPDIQIHGVSIDTRTLAPGDLFVALQGGQTNGHAYAAQAAAKGAGAILVSVPLPNITCPQIVVADTQQALEAMGVQARKRLAPSAHVVAITGSVGKTSTKEMLRHLLSAFGPTSWPESSYNNHWGVPLTLARMPRETQFAIFEVGMNHPGEIAPLARQIRPHIGVITAIAPAHIGFMETLKAIAEEKSALFEGLEPGGTAFIPADSPFSDFLESQARAAGCSACYRVGHKETADYQLLSHTHQKTMVRMGTSKSPLALTFKHLLGAHQALNALFCMGILQHLNLPFTPEQLEALPATAGRGVKHQLPNGIVLIDDAYNANPSSMAASLGLLCTLSPEHSGRRLVVIGEMLELGTQARAAHDVLSDNINTAPIDQAFYVGTDVVAQAFRSLSPSKKAHYARTPEDLWPSLATALKPHDILLVKGSKGSGVHRLVQRLLEAPHAL